MEPLILFQLTYHYKRVKSYNKKEIIILFKEINCYQKVKNKSEPSYLHLSVINKLGLGAFWLFWRSWG